MRLAAACMGLWLSCLPAAAVQDGPQVRMVAEFDEV